MKLSCLVLILLATFLVTPLLAIELEDEGPTVIVPDFKDFFSADEESSSRIVSLPFNPTATVDTTTIGKIRVLGFYANSNCTGTNYGAFAPMNYSSSGAGTAYPISVGTTFRITKASLYAIATSCGVSSGNNYSNVNSVKLLLRDYTASYNASFTAQSTILGCFAITCSGTECGPSSSTANDFTI